LGAVGNERFAFIPFIEEPAFIRIKNPGSGMHGIIFHVEVELQKVPGLERLFTFQFKATEHGRDLHGLDIDHPDLCPASFLDG
jgi:hypothetical protein